MYIARVNIYKNSTIWDLRLAECVRIIGTVSIRKLEASAE